MNPATNKLFGKVIEVARRPVLLQDAEVHHRDAIRHGHRFDLVVGYVQHGRLESMMQLSDLCSRLDAKFGIEVRERFVHQEHGGIAHQRTTKGDALTLTTRESWPGLRFNRLREVQYFGRALHGLFDLALGTLRNFSRNSFVGHGQVWVERVTLEDQRDVTIP